MTAVPIELRDGIAVLTLSAPQKRNAVSRRLLGDLEHALAEAVSCDAHALVLTGAGPVFSAGADVDELTGTVDDLAIDQAISAAALALRSYPLPIVAAIEGACVGAGVDLALACDVRVVADDAFFAVPAVALGILYNPAALERMARSVPFETLGRLLLLGERIVGADAVAAGLAARAVPAGTVLETALEWARGAAGGVPEARAATKAVLVALSGGEFDATAWQDTRLALLASDSRDRRLRAARNRIAGRT